MPLLWELSRTLRRAANALDVLHKDDRRGGRAGDVLDEYVVGMPNAQKAIDALPGWNHALPEHTGAKTGGGAFYNDPRILWALEQFGSIEGRKILELGPLEGSHSYILDQANPALVQAIEANKLSFLRCLVVKEILNLRRVSFLLGDFVEWLERSDERYDLIVACGVLYHMQDPIRLLELISSHSDAFFLWTHYADDAAMPINDPRRGAFIGSPETREYKGVSVRLHKRSYYGAWRSKSFCGGPHDLHRWIERSDLLALISALGFADIRVAHDEPHHQNGPAFSIFARRDPLATAAEPNGIDRQ